MLEKRKWDRPSKNSSRALASAVALVVLLLLQVPQLRELKLIQDSLRCNAYTWTNTSGMLLNGKEPLNSIVPENQYDADRKSELVLHVGPMKTGTTSIQLNIIGNKKYANFFQSNRYQLIRGFDYLPFGKLITECLRVGPEECNYSYWNQLKRIYEEARDKTAFDKSPKHPWNSSNTDDAPVHYTLHSVEAWSGLPESNFTLSLIKDLFFLWDTVHIIIFYRPFGDWLPSMHSQSQKYLMARPRNPKSFWKQDYIISRDKQMLLPQFLRHVVKSDHLRDTLRTYEFFQSIKSNIEGASEKKTVVQLHTMQMNSPDHSIEQEFLCNLPGIIGSCDRSVTLGKSKAQNKIRLPLNADLIVIEAWNQQLVSIPLHDAAVTLEERMEKLNTSMSELPQVCISDEEERWIWNRMRKSEEMFARNPSSKSIEALRSRFDLALAEKRYCSVNVTASLEIDSFRAIFHNCAFQSPTFLRRNLRTGGPNPLWDRLGCEKV